ncbi:hypothetical protein LTR97_007307 [Elasticomyces elasticus]|uniref:F-box domain-containing protein n=1 Tax=Elasticomyces elasticus TaxID=574655 RepID=A0AAN7W4L5_9PEZI|nr:hypothetical protein LTR97_007307 [Elasticomyces elasticus]
MVSIATLPNELLLDIAERLNPQDQISLGQTSRAMQTFVQTHEHTLVNTTFQHYCTRLRNQIQSFDLSKLHLITAFRQFATAHSTILPLPTKRMLARQFADLWLRSNPSIKRWSARQLKSFVWITVPTWYEHYSRVPHERDDQDAFQWADHELPFWPHDKNFARSKAKYIPLSKELVKHLDLPAFPREDCMMYACRDDAVFRLNRAADAWTKADRVPGRHTFLDTEILHLIRILPATLYAFEKSAEDETEV